MNHLRGVTLLMIITLVTVFMVDGLCFSAEKYPTKPITIIVHSKAGGGADVLVKQVGQYLKNILGQPIISESRYGGSGATAMQFTSGARPDGYTLLAVTDTFLITPILEKTPKNIYDFVPIARLLIDPMVLYVRTESKYDANSFLQEMKSGDGNLKIAGTHLGSPETMVLQTLIKQYGCKIHMVPFPGNSMLAVLGGEVEAGMAELAEITPQLLGKTVKILFALTSQRIPQYPDIQTLVEVGFPKAAINKFRGFVAPKGTPPEIIGILEEAFRKVLDDPEYKKVYTNNLQVAAYQNAMDFGKFIKDQENGYKAYFESLPK
jgi:putative tricarboxylic transport membrane protein